MKTAPKILFVTGTDTGIGKTTVLTLLYANLCKQGVNVRALKPIETGCAVDEMGRLHAHDANLLSLADKGLPYENIFYRFSHAVAPKAALELEKVTFDYKQLVARIKKSSLESEYLLVEGTGGLLVPIVEDYTFVDIARECAMEALVVVGSRLGAINHAALTFEALQSEGISCVGYVFNDLFFKIKGESEKDALQTNRDLLREVGRRYGIKELCALPVLEDLRPTRESISSYADHGEIQRLTVELLAHYRKKELLAA